MGFLQSLALAGLTLCYVLQTEAATICLYDGTGTFVKHGASQTVLTPAGVSTLLSALLRTEASVAPLASRQARPASTTRDSTRKYYLQRTPAWRSNVHRGRT